MKKITAMILCLLMVAGVFSACSADPKTELTNATKKTSELSSYESNIKMSIDMSASGVSVEIPVDMNVKYSLKDDKMLMSSDMSLELMNMKMQIKMYYADGYMYTEAMGQKVKQAMSVEEAAKSAASISALSDGMITELTTEKVDGGTKYTPTIDDAQMMDYVRSAMSKAQESISDATASEALDNLDIRNLQTYLVVGNDGYVNEQWMSMEINSKMAVTGAEETDVTMGIELTNTFVNPGKDVTVTAPEDLDSYVLDGTDL